MKVRYRQQVSRSFKGIMLILASQAVFWLIYGYVKGTSSAGYPLLLLIIVSSVLQYTQPIRITEKNRLHDGWTEHSYFVDIDSIHTVFYGNKGGILVYYTFQGSERKHLYRVKAEEQEELVATLKQLNPNINLEQESDYEV
ncbi:hypothetical protein M2459_001794 [Parabacteroides sp. PF5-5]|uniref:hypothetical protein n=1 Tax=unclassified Parabacteroides TaxID=2649774 RepID=UPI0024756C59|nr:MULTISPECIES: hypothetical protein [unclassified Parabacteroides]MDH6305057.1 hypothetical protein [Parabacteroides sp. PH5-39]MDH6315858.1 hypothetical protein [Parabacteroides sp. PF5-13]MDH6319515.1 hypothetical protein [Parabacteroides sp. PH5-13]MDH6323246.1 hypothetical protein [Parabacteroides sp. PH5-8]MDH6327246.1 hypothetical protein [Parabacteroides sp. PH5-41]